VAEYHHKRGNERAVEHLQASAAALIAYVDDEEALLQAAKNFKYPNWRKAFLPSLKKFQKDWIKTQRDF
jgi:hypothetical protein